MEKQSFEPPMRYTYIGRGEYNGRQCNPKFSPDGRIIVDENNCLIIRFSDGYTERVNRTKIRKTKPQQYMKSLFEER